MKVAIPAKAAALDAEIDRRFGQCAHLLVVDTETMAFEAREGPAADEGSGAGIAVVTLALDLGADAVLADYLPPHIAGALEGNGVEVVVGVRGSVRAAVERYARGERARGERAASEQARRGGPVASAVGRAARQFAMMAPVLVGVVLLIGLFKALVPREAVAAVFSGVPVADACWGACLGSILAGNPVNSYVIGGTLLDSGASLAGVSAFLLTWVTVGLVQLPAEVSALGLRFALTRSVAALGAAVPLALLIALAVGWLG